MDIIHHCTSKRNFKDKHHQIRAFLYTDYSIEPHNHDFYEINIVFKGTGTHQIEDRCFTVQTGDVFVIPPMAVHAYFNTSDLDIYHILLHNDFILENQKEAIGMPGFLQLVEIEPFLRQHFEKTVFLRLSPRQLLQLKHDLIFIADGGFTNEKYIPLKKHAMLKILYWLSYLLSEQIQTAGNNSSNNNYTTAIIQSLEYMHQNFSDKITIELLCQQTFLSRSTFLRNFYNICKCTPIEYLNKYRSEKALEMIAISDFSKTEIAHQCGFYDLSHMERMIKKYGHMQ